MFNGELLIAYSSRGESLWVPPISQALGASEWSKVNNESAKLSLLWLIRAMPTAPGSSVDITLSTGSTVSRHIWLRAVLKAKQGCPVGH